MTDDEFRREVVSCVEDGCQYRISFGEDPLQPIETMNENIIRSFAIRLAKQLTKRGGDVLQWDCLPEATQLLCDVVSLITGGDKKRLVVVNLDETNRLDEAGQAYLHRLRQRASIPLRRRLDFCM